MKAILISIIFLSIAGCATAPTQPLTSDDTVKMESKTLILVERETPSFVALTPGKAMFSLVGVLAATAEGKQLLKDNNIKDPAMDISNVLAKSLSEKYSMDISGSTKEAVKTDNMKTLVLATKENDYALDVRTFGWSYNYDGGGRINDYYVTYQAKARVIDVNSSKVIASSTCTYQAKKMGRSPLTHKSLLANQASQLKQEINLGVDYCTNEFKTKLI